MAEDKENDASGDEDWAGAIAEQGNGEAANADATENSGLSDILNSVIAEEIGAVANNLELEMILDIPVVISMEIGRSQISIRNLLKLNQGSVVELDRLAGEPLDVMVNGTLIAHGEVVVVNEKFGIRLTDVITAMERVQKLQ